MSFRPKTAQAQRPDRKESSIPIPWTKSIPTLGRQVAPQGTAPPLPLGISRTQSQVPIPIHVGRNGLSRKPSVPLRSGLSQTQTQVNRKTSTTRLRSAPTHPPITGRERERKPLPARSGLDPTETHTQYHTERDLGRGPYSKRPAPVLPSINSVPIVNRLSRKASIPIIARATYITPPGGFKFGKSNVKGNEKEREETVEDIFQGGSSFVEPGPVPTKAKEGIQKMMMRGTKIERPDELGRGQELQDMSVDLNGTPSPTKPTGKITYKPLNHQLGPRSNQNGQGKEFKPHSQLARSPFKIGSNNHSFDFNSPIRPPRHTHPEATPLFPRWPKDNGYIVDVDEMSMLGEESFRFTGDSIEITSPRLLSKSIAVAPSEALALSGIEKGETVIQKNAMVDDLERLKQEEEIKMIEGRIATITLERDDAILAHEKRKEDMKEMAYEELRRGIEMELERCGEYRGWLGGLRDLIAERGDLS